MNKREQQRKIKEQKELASKQRQQTQKLVGKVALFGALPLLALIALYTFFSQGPTYSTVEIADNDHLRGNRQNPVSIVVYADFQCPACATEHEAMTQLWPSVRDKAHLIFRHFPITAAHPNSWSASLYAEAAGKQGKFWEMHDFLFATQPIWSTLRPAEPEFDAYALELNLDLDQLKLDIETEEVVRKIRNDQRGGNSAGVLATPAVFINGRLLSRPTRERIIEVVEEEYTNAAG
jgi:protein-disulfide isomerase